MIKLKQKYGLLLIGIALGIAYGLFTRLVFGRAATLASITYLFIVPVILGVIPLMFADDEKLRSYRKIIFIPWLTIATFCLTLVLVGLEDIICLLILAGPFIILGTVGALMYRFTQIEKKRSKGKMLTIVLLPFLFAPVESHIESPSKTFTVQSEVIINAAPEKIWNNIVEVPTIAPGEYSAGIFNWLGIPRPISASVDKKQIGGHRTGSFDGGLRFIETITAYEAAQRICFDIKVDPATVRQKVFDQHVLKGNYFSFVNATYELTPLNNGQVKLTLTSGYRLTSTINFYGKFWGDIILKDFQDRLLDVIKKRCDTKPRSS